MIKIQKNLKTSDFKQTFTYQLDEVRSLSSQKQATEMFNYSEEVIRIQREDKKYMQN